MNRNSVKNYTEAFRFSTFKGYVYFVYDFNKNEC